MVSNKNAIKIKSYIWEETKEKEWDRELLLFSISASLSFMLCAFFTLMSISIITTKIQVYKFY